jgi:hypothetical protein
LLQQPAKADDQKQIIRIFKNCLERCIDRLALPSMKLPFASPQDAWAQRLMTITVTLHFTI